MRQSGYYWVLQSELGWIIAEYVNSYKFWFIPGIDEALTNNDFEEIDERKIERL